jgi:hypothetical protein
MSLAKSCFGADRQEWARAMEVEFEVALVDGKPLSFAMGCLLAAWREMPAQKEGRFALVSHAFAILVLIPMAALQVACAVRLPFFLQGSGGLYGMLAVHDAQKPYADSSILGAAPTLLALWLTLALCHLRLAWALLDRDWRLAAKTAALTGSALASLTIFTGVLFLDATEVALQAAVLAVELCAIYATAQWHARLFADRLSGNFAW